MKWVWVLLVIPLLVGAYAVTSRSAGQSAPRAYSDAELERLMQGVFIEARPAIVQLRTIDVEESVAASSEPRSLTISEGRATGFFISADGYVLTAYHAVSGQSRVNVLTTRQELLNARVVGFDESRDLAVLKAEVRGSVPFLQLELQRAVKPGSPLVEIGNAQEDFIQPRYGVSQEFEQDNGNLVPTRLLFSSIPLHPGDSGGAVLNFEARVVAVGIGYAISDVRRVALLVPLEGLGQTIADLKRGSRLRLPGVGLHVVHHEAGGVRIERVEPRSSAKEAGLSGGVVTAVDGQLVRHQSDYFRLLRAKRSGDRVRLKVQTSQQAREYTLELR